MYTGHMQPSPRCRAKGTRRGKPHNARRCFGSAPSAPVSEKPPSPLSPAAPLPSPLAPVESLLLHLSIGARIASQRTFEDRQAIIVTNFFIASRCHIEPATIRETCVYLLTQLHLLEESTDDDLNNLDPNLPLSDAVLCWFFRMYWPAYCLLVLAGSRPDKALVDPRTCQYQVLYDSRYVWYQAIFDFFSGRTLPMLL